MYELLLDFKRQLANDELLRDATTHNGIDWRFYTGKIANPNK